MNQPERLRQSAHLLLAFAHIASPSSQPSDLAGNIVVRVAAGAADRSTVGTWAVEASAISVMTSSGWTPRTYKPGDPITVVAHPNMDGSEVVLLFYAIKTDGKRLYRAAHRYDGEKE